MVSGRSSRIDLEKVLHSLPPDQVPEDPFGQPSGSSQAGSGTPPDAKPDAPSSFPADLDLLNGTAEGRTTRTPNLLAVVDGAQRVDVSKLPTA
mgnify:CR=1 FL=1